MEWCKLVRNENTKNPKIVVAETHGFYGYYLLDFGRDHTCVTKKGSQQYPKIYCCELKGEIYRILSINSEGDMEIQAPKNNCPFINGCKVNIFRSQYPFQKKSIYDNEERKQNEAPNDIPSDSIELGQLKVGTPTKVTFTSASWKPSAAYSGNAFIATMDTEEQIQFVYIYCTM